jgi:hypothetical protein
MQRRTQTADRRRHPRGTLDGEPPQVQVVLMVLGMYEEMPGLSLDVPQAVRLLGLPPVMCRLVLDELVSRGHLFKNGDGQYLARSSVA